MSLEQFTSSIAPLQMGSGLTSAASIDSMHQLAPYIGKLKPPIARYLLSKFTNEGDTILDCFSGSGTIPLEAALLGRHVIAADSNPYAIVLTRAKLRPPTCIQEAVSELAERFAASESRSDYDLTEIPQWVQKFFHSRTLQSAIKFADECISKDDPFLLSCLLSILHHQRPGFLSFPSSHLVPYLRDRMFPEHLFPQMYEERALYPRLLKKINRSYKNYRSIHVSCRREVLDAPIQELQMSDRVDAIVSSPPYMNALDYIRDNRLRMWFLDRKTTDYSPEPTDSQIGSDAITAAFASNALSFLKKGGLCVLIIGETVSRKRITTHPAQRIYTILKEKYEDLTLEYTFSDDIPDVRRSRRDGSATKKELIIVLRK